MCVKRRILSLLCAAALLLSLAVPALGVETTATPGNTITEGVVTGKVNPDGQSVTITKITYTPTDPARYELPSTLGGLAVTGLGAYIFSGPGGYYMTSLAIPASVTAIDPEFIGFRAENQFVAFEVATGNLNYKSEGGVLYTKDGTELFAFPEGKAGTFAVPGTVKRIGAYAFNSSSLTSVTLSSGLESIGDYAFQSVFDLKGLVIPDSVTALGENIFNGCNHLTDLTLPGGLETIPAGLASGTALKSVVLGEGTKVIDTGAFKSCDSLTSVTLPSTLTTIGENAFYDCDGLTAIAFPNSLTTIGPSAFSSCSRLANITWGTGLTSIGKNAFGDTSFNDASLKTLPASVTSLGNNAFNSTKITKVTAETLPASLTALPDGLFSSCKLLTTVSLPNTVTSMGAGVFSHCAALTDVTLPGSLSEIPDHTFNTCEALSSVIIPASVTRIGAGAFSSNYMLTEIALPAGLTTLGDGAFQSCRGLKSIAIPAGVKELPVNAFSHCWALGSVTLSEGLTTVHHYAFEQCKSLGEITFPKSLTDLSRLTFMYNPALSRVTFLGDRPTTKDSSSSSESNPFGGVVVSGLKVYYPTGNASYELWTEKEYSDSFTLVPGLPTDPDKMQAGITLTASLARMPQKNLLLWLTTAVTPTTGHTSDSKLLPTGAITAYFNGTALASPVYFVSGGNSLSRTFGYDVTNLIDTAPLTVKVALADSLGFTGTFSNELTGTVTNHQSQDWLPFGTGSSDPIINTEYGWRPSEEGKGVVLTSLPSNLLPATKSRAADATAVTLPGDIDGTNVTGLGASLFSGTAVTEVVIPDTVTTIEADVFKDCGGLTSIILPAALKTIGADAFQGSALTSVTFLGMTAPTLAEGNNPFPKGAILHIDPKAEGFTGGAWDAAKQVALGITFPDFYTEGRFTVGPEIGKMTLNLPNLFDTSAYPGETAPALDPSKLTVELTDAYNKVIPATFTLSGDILQVQIPPALFDTRIHLTVSYSGDGNYTAVTAWTGGTGTTPFPVPVQKIPLAITKVDAEVKKDETDKLCLYLTPAFNPPNYYGQSGTEPYLVLLHVMLNDKEVTVTSTKDSPTVKAAIPDDLIGHDAKVEVVLQGNSVHFETPTNTVILEDVYLSDTPKPPEPTKPTLTGIAITAPPSKTVYTVGDSLDTTGMVVTATYSDDSTETLTAQDYVVAPTGEFTEVKTVTITVTYLEKTATFDVTVSEVVIPEPDPVTLTGIAITTPPSKTIYIVGDSLDTTGMAVTATYSDGTAKTLTAQDYVVAPTGEFTEVKTVTITVTYEGQTATFDITVRSKPTPEPDPNPPSDDDSSTPPSKPSGGTDSKVTVSNKDATQAVKDAANSGSVVLKAEARADAKSVAVTVPASVMKAVAKAEAPVSIQSPVADLTLDLKVLEALQANGVKDVVVSAGAADAATLPKAAQTALTGRPVYDINITSGGKSVSQFGGGTVTVALPYTLAPGENPACLTVCWVKEDGTTEVLHSSAYRDGKLTFRTSHLSTYAIIHTNQPFLDVTADNWGKTDIDFAVSRGILKGVGDNGAGSELFGPNVPLTGGMAVVALARMDGVADHAPAADGTPNPDWAVPALDWAKKKNILPPDFDLAAPMTREQFAYLVAGFLGGGQGTDGLRYVDVIQISLPCLDSVNYLTTLGIIQGTGDGLFSPKATLTRSELAAILHRLVVFQLK